MASVSAQYIKDILNTLPIGYYLGERAEIEFSETAPTSMCNPVTGKIVISANNVLEALKDMPNDADTEEFIRDALYHEVSHLILTPRCAAGYGSYERKIYPYMNIFEDERIESILKNFYRKVNFKRFVFTMNHWTPDQEIKDATQFFFHIVRYRKGPEEFVRKVPELILKWHEINCNTPDWCEGSDWFRKNYAQKDGFSYNTFGYRAYDNDVYDFWKKVRDHWQKNNESSNSSSRNESQEKRNPFEDNSKQDPSQDKSSSENSNSSTEKDEQNADETQDDILDNAPETDEQASNSSNDVDGSESEAADEVVDQKDPIEIVIEEAESQQDLPDGITDEVCSNIRDIIRSAMAVYSDPTVASSIRRIITRACKKRANRTGVVNKYAGRIDPKSVGTRHDYRWFQQGGDNGCSKFNRVHLTLWVDKSGSFAGSMHKLNCVLKSLNDAEKIMPREFSFDVVAMDYDNKQVSKDKPLAASGGNFFGPDVEELSRKLTRPGWSNYNVVVWDGDLASDRRRSYGSRSVTDYLRDFRRAFNVFNNQQSIIVTDTFNERYLKKTCKNARMKLLDMCGYAETFTKVVLDLLDHML